MFTVGIGTRDRSSSRARMNSTSFTRTLGSTAFQWPSAVQPRRSRPYTTGSICRSMFRCSNNFETSRLLPSDTQRAPLAWASCQQTIYPGVPAELYRFNPRPGKYLAFIGSLSMGKGLGMAIEIARRAHLPLRVASRQNSIDGLPFSIPSKLLVVGNGVEWLGELTEPEKISFLGEPWPSSALRARPSLLGSASRKPWPVAHLSWPFMVAGGGNDLRSRHRIRL